MEDFKAMRNKAKQTDHPTSLRLLMFPWLAYGHITPFLELAKKFADRGIYIYLCSTPINLNSISKKIPVKYSQSIELVEFHLPNLPEFPPSYHTTNGLPLHLRPTLINALKLSQPQLDNVLEALKPDLVVYDALLTIFGLTLSFNIPALEFHIGNAAVLAYLSHVLLKPGLEYPFTEISLCDFELTKVLHAAGDYLQTPPPPPPPADPGLPMLVNTCRKMEAKHLDYSASFGIRKVFPVGPLVQYPETNKGDDQEDDETINFLRQKTAHSTIFVSFGSECVLTGEEIREIALGLELSNANFIWVLRIPKGEESTGIEQILPEGFLERVKDRGIIVQGWAPQAKILGHPSIGGFMSHCGWNSSLEGIEFGVPIIAIPMNFDQPINARLMVGIGVAVEVVRDENQKFKGAEIAKLVKKVVFGDAGKIMRQKIKDMSKNMKSTQEEDLDGVVAMLSLLSKKTSANCDAIL